MVWILGPWAQVEEEEEHRMAGSRSGVQRARQRKQLSQMVWSGQARQGRSGWLWVGVGAVVVGSPSKRLSSLVSSAWLLDVDLVEFSTACTCSAVGKRASQLASSNLVAERRDSAVGGQGRKNRTNKSMHLLHATVPYKKGVEPSSDMECE